MKMLKLMQENKKLRKENEKLKQTVQILLGIIETEDECVNQLLANSIEDAKRLAGKHSFW